MQNIFNIFNSDKFILSIIIISLITSSCGQNKNDNHGNNNKDKDIDSNIEIVKNPVLAAEVDGYQSDKFKNFNPVIPEEVDQVISPDGQPSIVISSSNLVDMVVVADNSRSMNRFSMQKNISPMLKRLLQENGNYFYGNTGNKKLDLNIALISAKSSIADDCVQRMFKGSLLNNEVYDRGSYLYLGLLKDKIQRINCHVESASPLKVLSHFIQGVKLAGSDFTSYDFFRDNSKKVFLVISDDFSLGITKNDFDQAVADNVAYDSVKFYSISSRKLPYRANIGYTNTDITYHAPYNNYIEGYTSSDCGNNYTTTYDQLSIDYNAKRFDICAASWNSYASEILSDIIQ